jgi:photosystem II stability/assembly factor-like uncharacterized protein
MRALLICLLAATPIWCFAQGAGIRQPGVWQIEPSETTADLRGVHAVGGGVVWASGTGGTVLRSQDSGFEWQQCAMPPGAKKLDFRSIWAWDDQTAVVMSSGPGALSRLYKTTDGCAHWTLLFTNPEPGGFYDGLIFLDRNRGFLIGDATRSGPKVAPVEGGYYALRIRATADGGKTWAPVVATLSSMHGSYDNAQPGEGIFAASNTSIAAQDGWIWLGTNQGRVLRASQASLAFSAGVCAGAVDPDSFSCGIPWTNWQNTVSPLASSSEAAGIFSLAFESAKQGVAVGGDYTRPAERGKTAAWTVDGGEHWTASTIPPSGYRSAVAWDASRKLWITVGPNGSDLSRDGGESWQPLESAPADMPKGGEWNALSLPWAVGPHGRIGKLNAELLPNAPK